MSSFTSSFFSLLLDYFICSSFNGNAPPPPAPSPKTLGQQPNWPTSAAVLSTGGPREDSADCFSTWFILDVIKLTVAPCPPLFLYLFNLWWWLCYIYTHRSSLTPLLFLLPLISIHLSIGKLNLKAKVLSDARLHEDFFKGHWLITEQQYRKYLCFEVIVSL